jgi:hypothetical protein
MELSISTVEILHLDPSTEIKTLPVSPRAGPTEGRVPVKRRMKKHYNLDSIRKLFQDEYCIVTSTDYRNVLSMIDYTYEDQLYHVQLYRWIKKGSTPHLPSAPKPTSYHKKYSADSIRQMFANENCQLSMPDDWQYRMNQDKINYIFDGKEYSTTINRWVNFHHRPHLMTPK